MLANTPVPARVNRMATEPKTRSCRITKPVCSRTPAHTVITTTAKASGNRWLMPNTVA
jgi:hypothetical protein